MRNRGEGSILGGAGELACASEHRCRFGACDTYITALSVSNQHRLKLWTAEDHGGAPRFNPKK
jgi:hypothetical protein